MNTTAMSSITHFDLLAEAERDGFRSAKKSVGKVQGQYNGPCIIPSGCGGTGNDRLRIQPNVGSYGRFVCSICGLSGSGVDWLMIVRGMSKNEALAYAGWTPKDGSTPYLTRSNHVVSQLSLAEKSETWQITAFNLARAARQTMNDETRAYLHSRQITDALIAEYAMGLYDQYKKVKASLWGGESNKRMYIPRGIVIPWVDDSYHVRCVRIRRLPEDESEQARDFYGVEKDGSVGRYKALYGSCSTQFYQGHKIIPGCKVAMFEGEFTCMVAQDACRDQGIVCIATGSASWCRNDANVRLLASCSQVLICFDTDENSAGDKASVWWLDRLENARRWRPLWGDANDMVIDGVDVGAWLILGFEQDTASTLRLVTINVAEPNTDQEGTKTVPIEDETEKNREKPRKILAETSLSSAVEQEDYSYEPTSEDQAWLEAQMGTFQPCGACLNEDRETPATGECEGIMYCADHMPVSRQLTRDEIVERFGTALPGWNITLEPRTTLRQKYPTRSKWLGKTSIPDEVWLSLPRGAIWQEIESYQIESDYWASTEAKLTESSYMALLDESDRQLLHVDIPARVYPGPVPRYELQEDESGVKRVVVVGYWAGQSQEVSA